MSIIAIWRRFLFLDINAITSLSGLFLIQLCYSIAPVYLGLAIQGIGTNETSIPMYVGIYFILNFIPYFITAVSNISHAKWIITARKRIHNVVLDTVSTKYSLLQSGVSHQKYNALVTNNSQTIVSDTIEYTYGMFSYLSSTILTMAVITVFAKPLLLYAYLLSIVLCAIVIVCTRTNQERFSKIKENTFHKIISLLSHSWAPSILRQNPYWDAYKNELEMRWSRYGRIAVKTAIYGQIVSSIQAVIIWLPMVASILYLLSHNGVSNTLVLLGFIPRIVELLLDISNLVMRFISFNGYTGKLKWLQDELNSITVPPKNLPISENDITVSIRGEAEKSAREVGGVSGIMDVIEGGKVDRITIRGPNGSGKSTLLISLKTRLQQRALLILAQHRQIAASVEASLGQRVASEIDAAITTIETGRVSILLLDEWNGNLDRVNSSMLSNRLDMLPTGSTIVEVIHHISDSHVNVENIRRPV